MRLPIAGVAALSLLATSVLSGQTDTSRATVTVPAQTPIGETLLYDARYGFITLGRGMMHVAGVDTIRGVPSLHVVFQLRGGTFFYRLDNRMDSWVGLPEFTSRRFVQDFQEGRSERHTEYEIFPDSGFYLESGVDSIRPTSVLPLDDAAFFYFVRMVELEVGERYEFDRYFRPDRNPVILEVLGRDTLDLPAGRFPTIVVRPTIKGRGILAESQEPRMWLSDDERRLMIQLKSKFPFGTITLRLREIADAPPPELLER